MGNVKSNIETIAEQMNFLEKSIELISSIDHDKKKLHILLDESHLPLLNNILANLRMVHSWVMLPDFHQASLHILDGAHDLNAALQKGGDAAMSLGDYLDNIYLLTQRSATGQIEAREAALSIAMFSLVAVAKFIVPTKPVKRR